LKKKDWFYLRIIDIKQMATNEGFWNMLCSCCDSNPPGGL